MIVTRFAPSPTGLLHLGHAFAALTAADAGTRFLLRIEDIDTARCREDFVAAIVEDLRWLGLAWEEPVLRQSARGDAYRLMVEHAADMGANAIIGVRYDANEVAAGVTEVLAYGSAVVAERE